MKIATLIKGKYEGKVVNCLRVVEQKVLIKLQNSVFFKKNSPP